MAKQAIHDGKYLFNAYKSIKTILNIDYARVYSMVKSYKTENSKGQAARTINSEVSNTMKRLSGPNLSWIAFILFLRVLRIPKVDVRFTLHLRSGEKVNHEFTINLDKSKVPSHGKE